MASWQAYFASWILRRRLKPKLRASRDLLESRKLLTPPPYRVPSDTRITAAVVGSIAGEWVEAADLAGLPPLLIHVGTNETLLDDSVRLAGRARAAGVTVELKIWPVVPHTWQLAQSTIPEARKSVREAAAFLRTAAAQTD